MFDNAQTKHITVVAAAAKAAAATAEGSRLVIHAEQGSNTSGNQQTKKTVELSHNTAIDPQECSTSRTASHARVEAAASAISLLCEAVERYQLYTT
jgi:hypothetical protein